MKTAQKITLITGAAKGIGSATALALSKMTGCKVIISDVHKTALETTIALILEAGGHPLGIRWSSYLKKLIVADEQKGILTVSLEGEVAALFAKQNGVPFYFSNNLVATQDGFLYFTNATTRNKHEDIKKETWGSHPPGRLLRYDIKTKGLTTLVEPLYFGNGVGFATDESFLTIVATRTTTLKKYWLKGPKNGQIETTITSTLEHKGALWKGFNLNGVILKYTNNQNLK